MKPMAKVDLSKKVMSIEKARFGKFAWKNEANFMKYADRGDAFVVRDADEVVGYVLLKECEGGLTISIVKMAVALDRQNQGLGRFILDWTRAHAEGKGAKRLVLHVRGSNTKAFDLYERNGFKVTERKESGYRTNKPTGADKIRIAMQLAIGRKTGQVQS
jgi:ribosomal protein S18 acetylase RimI-like enzyme